MTRSGSETQSFNSEFIEKVECYQPQILQRMLLQQVPSYTSVMMQFNYPNPGLDNEGRLKIRQVSLVQIDIEDIVYYLVQAPTINPSTYDHYYMDVLGYISTV
mmetsp:Transcript_17976/g.33498  ORF Transcript_17976/g.33498 Transcript_17976/m.33498 type:complete len:103 (+) Transcript_17976:1441-1749(+)